MINAVVLYGTPDQPNKDVFQIGIALFNALAIDNYNIHLNQRNQQGYNITRVVNQQDLVDLFAQGLFNFEISQNIKGRLVYFSQSVSSVSSFNTIKFGGFFDSELPSEQSNDYLAQILNHAPCQYGFSYHCNHSLKAINYVHDIGVVKLNTYDAPMKWQRKFIYNKDDNEYGRHLRIIYERNYLTDGHLQLKIAGKSLPQWIKQARYRGTLSRLNENVYLWQVAAKHLEKVNRQCGEAGLLISYAEPKKSPLFLTSSKPSLIRA